MYVVKRPFTTPTQRFAVGDKVTGDDLAGPVPVGHWLQQKFIEAEKVQKTGKQATSDPAPVPNDTPATAASEMMRRMASSAPVPAGTPATAA